MSDKPWESEASRKWEEWRLNQDAANRAHDRYHADQAEMFKSVIAFGVEAIRTASLINGGASVASIALVGAIFQHDQKLASNLSLAIIIFACGVLASGLASGFAYFSQFMYERHLDTWQLTFDHPYIVEGKSNSWRYYSGIASHFICIACIAAAYVCLGVGAWTIWRTISPGFS